MRVVGTRTAMRVSAGWTCCSAGVGCTWCGV